MIPPFVQLTSKNITKSCSQQHYAFAEVEKVCHIILLTWMEKNKKKDLLPLYKNLVCLLVNMCICVSGAQV